MNMTNCPACGKPESSWGDSFCGPCERAYQESLREERRERIARLLAKCRACPARDDCDGECRTAQALIEMRAI
jgi:radical SAM protein with 4Fe4S-binding SPASM domain